MKIIKIIHWIATGLLCLMMLGSAGFYIFNYPAVSEGFNKLGFPAFIVYPLAIAKILGALTLLIKPSKILKEWAYAGFFFVFILALSGHLVAQDGGFGGAATALVLWAISYFTDKKIENQTGARI